MSRHSLIRVLGLHWGFMPGGVAKYATFFEDVGRYGPIRISSVCIASRKWRIDNIAASKMQMKFLPIKNSVDPSWVWKARGYIKQENPELIFTFGFNGSFVAALSAVGLGIPIISSWHGVYVGTTLFQKIRAPFFNLLSTMLLKYVVKYIVTVSEYSKNVLIQQSVNENKIKRIYNGISILEKSEFPSKLRIGGGVRNGEILVGTACRLDVTKDLPTFLRAICLVAKVMNGIKFVIWGEGPQKDSLLRLAKTLEIDSKVNFAGYEQNIDFCLQSLDIFVLSSILENFSIALLEAMRAGLPIIATGIGGNLEAVKSNKHAILVSPKNPEALAQGIIKLAKSKGLREKMGTAAHKKFCEDFTSERMVHETAKWLLECARGSSSM